MPTKWFTEESEIPEGREILAVIEGPRGNRFHQVIERDPDGYLLSSSPDGPAMIGRHLVVVKWRPLPKQPEPNLSKQNDQGMGRDADAKVNKTS